MGLGCGAALCMLWGGVAPAPVRLDDPPTAPVGAPAPLAATLPPSGARTPADDVRPVPAALRTNRAGADDPALREVLVVDETGRGLPGVSLGARLTFRSDGVVHADGGPIVTTDGAGRAMVRCAERDVVRFFAPGRRLTDQRAPASTDAWTVVLPAALRIEAQVRGTADFRGLFVRVESDCAKDALRFWQSKYVQTPGRAVDDTAARWELLERRGRPSGLMRSRWELCLSATGAATLDQLEVEGDEVSLQLLRFGRVLDRRTLTGDALRAIARLDLFAPALAPVVGVVVDPGGRPLAGARLRMAPYGGLRIVDSPGRGEPFPVWAPDVAADAFGRFALPRADDPAERVVVTCDGHAARVLTLAELDASAGSIVLAPGRTVRVEIRDCVGKPLDGGWTTGGREYAEPSVLLGHDVWRGVSDDELPWFEFAELPAGLVTFRCAGETWRHDTALPAIRFLTEGPVEEMGIGK